MLFAHYISGKQSESHTRKKSKMTEETTPEVSSDIEVPPVPVLPPVKVAFIIDGEVVDVLHTDERLGAIFLSEPAMVDVSEHYAANPGINLVNATYDGTTFTPATPETV